MKAKHKRLIFILFSLVSMGAGVFLFAQYFNQNLIFFYSPTEYSQTKNNDNFKNKVVRIGGLVKKSSLKIEDKAIYFSITDGNQDIKVEYHGLLPNLFREEQGMIAQGSFDKNEVLQAKTLLTKHDEKYMPKELVESLKKQGRWNK